MEGRLDAALYIDCLSNEGLRAVFTYKLAFGGGTGNPYQTMTFGGWRVLPRAEERAVEPCIEYGLRATAAIRELGYSSRA